MAKRKPLMDEDGEVREITAEDVALFKPFSALPQAEQRTLRAVQMHDPVREAWLKDDVAPSIKAVKANSGSVRTGVQMRAALAQAHKKVQNAE
jgi:hypothetical protein